MAFFVIGCYCCRCIPPLGRIFFHWLPSCGFVSGTTWSLSVLAAQASTNIKLTSRKGLDLLRRHGLCKVWPSLHPGTFVVEVCNSAKNTRECACCHEMG